jgi:hypothetical protein
VNPNLWSAIRSEWIKFRTVRSTITGVITLLVLTIGIGVLISFAIKTHFQHDGGIARIGFDPTATSLGGVLLAQFAVGTLGIIAMSSEYATGSIRTTLSAIPKRLRMVSAKAVVIFTTLLVVSEVAVFVAFLSGQAIYKSIGLSTTLSAPGVLRGVVLAGVYLALLALLGLGLGLIMRTTAASIIVYATLLLIVPIIVNFLPSTWQAHVTKLLPSELGQAMLAPTQPAGHYGWGVSTLILLGYVIAILSIGCILLERRDA